MYHSKIGISVIAFLLTSSLFSSTGQCQPKSVLYKTLVFSCAVKFSLINDSQNPNSRTRKLVQAFNPKVSEIMSEDFCSECEDLLIDEFSFDVVPYPDETHLNFSIIREKTDADAFLIYKGRSMMRTSDLDSNAKSTFRLVDLKNGKIICKKTIEDNDLRLRHLDTFIKYCRGKLGPEKF